MYMYTYIPHHVRSKLTIDNVKKLDCVLTGCTDSIVVIAGGRAAIARFVGREINHCDRAIENHIHEGIEKCVEGNLIQEI
jgi:hypothetical protein